MIIAELLIYIFGGYLIAGTIFSLYFSFFGVRKFDPSAKGAGIAFGLIIFFGAAALWPFLLLRLIRRVDGPVEVNSHRKAAGEN